MKRLLIEADVSRPLYRRSARDVRVATTGIPVTSRRFLKRRSGLRIDIRGLAISVSVKVGEHAAPGYGHRCPTQDEIYERQYH